MDHAVEHRDGQGGLALLTSEGARTQLRTDQVLVAADDSLDEVAPALASGLLPSHSALVGNQLGACLGKRLDGRAAG